MMFPSSVEQWRSTFELIRDRDIPIVVPLAWSKEESGGNPCATGIIRDGFNVEAGIGQQYFDRRDSNVGGVTSADLRAACGTNAHNQTPLRDLTEDEKLAHCTALLTDIRECREATRRELAWVNVVWPEDGADFWCMVKIHHGLPGIPKSFLPGFLRAKGIGPGSWRAWKQYVLGLELDAVRRIDHNVAAFAPLQRFFANAEGVGIAVGSLA